MTAVASQTTPRLAATLVLLRPGAHGPEVLMLQRAKAAAFLGGAYVFPGGALDPSDGEPRITRRITGFSPAQANRRLSLKEGGSRLLRGRGARML